MYVLVEFMERADNPDYYSVRFYRTEDDYDELELFKLDELGAANECGMKEASKRGVDFHAATKIG